MSQISFFPILFVSMHIFKIILGFPRDFQSSSRRHTKRLAILFFWTQRVSTCPLLKLSSCSLTNQNLYNYTLTKQKMFCIIRYSYSLFPTYWLNVLLYPFSNGGGRIIILLDNGFCSTFCILLNPNAGRYIKRQCHAAGMLV